MILHALATFSSLRKDIHCIDSPKGLMMQKACMMNLFKKGNNDGIGACLTRMRIVPNAESVDNPCEWNHVHCEQDIIHEIDWSSPNVRIGRLLKNGDHRPGRIMLHWFPSELHTLKINCQALYGHLQTRKLPRALNNLHLRVNYLEGTIDCGSFPEGLVQCFLSVNCFSGVVDLTGLPQKLEQLSLTSNDFAGVILANNMLPENLDYIQISKFKGASIREINGEQPDCRLNVLPGGKKRVKGRALDIIQV